MRRRSRTRRVLKWVGMSLSVVFISVFIASLGWKFSWTGRNSVSSCVAGMGFFEGWCGDGVISQTHAQTLARDLQPGLTGKRISRSWLEWKSVVASWWRLPRFNYDTYDTLLPDNLHVSVVAPLWIPIVLTLAPTVLLWRLDRRIIPAGHCQKCGYDLTGNVSGRCPECGKTVS